MTDVKSFVPYHDPHDNNDTVVLSDYILSDFGYEFDMNELLNQADDPNSVDITLNPSNDTYVQEILDNFINDPPIANHSSNTNIFLNRELPQTARPSDYMESFVARNAPISCDLCDVIGEMIHTDGVSH